MAIRLDVLPVAMPGLRAIRWSTDTFHVGMKEAYSVARLERGCTEWRYGTRLLRGAPGALRLSRPGDVYYDVARSAPLTFQIVVLPARLIESVPAVPLPPVEPQLAADDPRGAAMHRLHDAIHAGAERLALEVALVEAAAAFVGLREHASTHTRPVRRAIERLRAQPASPVTLDELAAHAGLDKFHLCRAFRAQVGLPPYAYLTRLRIMRAKQLLDGGARPSELAAQVGFCDQSQLHRHFRRLVGTTPGAYARRARS